MGLGLNSANDPTQTEIELPGTMQIRLLPDNMTNEQITDFKIHFGKWIVTNGVRELVETFAIYLDSVFMACLLMDQTVSKLNGEKRQRLLSGFHQRGISGKFQILKKRFGITIDFREHIESINRTRNCLTHRLGLVAVEDCNQEKRLDLKWRAFDISLREQNGKKTLINADNLPFVAENGGDIVLQMVDRKKSFKIGESIEIKGRELREICWTVIQTTEQIKSAVYKFANNQGIYIQLK